MRANQAAFFIESKVSGKIGEFKSPEPDAIAAALPAVKDVHSRRYTVAALAGCDQPPLPAAQSILGHASPETTSHYQPHTGVRQVKASIFVQPGRDGLDCRASWSAVKEVYGNGLTATGSGGGKIRIGE